MDSAGLAAQLAEALVTEEVKEQDIEYLSGYTVQVNLANIVFFENGLGSVEAHTIDKFQGEEASFRGIGLCLFQNDDTILY